MKNSFIVGGAIALAVSAAACGKKKEEPPAPATGTQATTGARAATGASAATGAQAATGTPAAPPPADDGEVVYHPRCATLVPQDLVARTHGADQVNVVSDGDQSAHCDLMKGTEPVGTIGVTCQPGLDSADAIAGYAVERQAMQQGAEITPPVGRAGYRVGELAYHILDDDTPCRLLVSWAAPPKEWEASLRAVMASVTPASIE